MLDDHDILSYLNHAGQRIAFHGLPGSSPGLFFLGGFASDMTGTKASYLAALAQTQGIGFTRFDYSGHGKSTGTIANGTIDGWLAESLAMLDEVSNGPQILIGSSLGGWLALLMAQQRPDRVRAIVGLAAAPDFTEDMIWNHLPPAEQQALVKRGYIEAPSEYGEPYRFTHALIESGRRHLVLRDELAIDCQVRLLHGMQDSDLPWQTSVRLAEQLTGSDVRLTLIKDAGHRLSRPGDLAVLRATVEELLD